jgi:hypothetical protein
MLRGVWGWNRGSDGHGDAADVGGTKRCNGRWKEKARAGDVVWCGVFRTKKENEERRKKVGKLSQVNL